MIKPSYEQLVMKHVFKEIYECCQLLWAEEICGRHIYIKARMLASKTCESHNARIIITEGFSRCYLRKHGGIKEKDKQLWKTALFRQLVFSTTELQKNERDRVNFQISHPDDLF